jgi:hypothetical protein
MAFKFAILPLNFGSISVGPSPQYRHFGIYWARLASICIHQVVHHSKSIALYQSTIMGKFSNPRKSLLLVGAQRSVMHASTSSLSLPKFPKIFDGLSVLVEHNMLSHSDICTSNMCDFMQVCKSEWYQPALFTRSQSRSLSQLISRHHQNLEVCPLQYSQIQAQTTNSRLKALAL